MNGRNGSKGNKHGIAAKGIWVPMPLEFLRSRACAELSPHGAKLLLDLLALLGPNATRNGDLSLAPKVMKTRGWSGRETLRAAVLELRESGLLVQTRQGSRLDCSLFAVTLFPLACDLKKLDVGPGSFTQRDFERAGPTPPTEAQPAQWRQVRKAKSVAPPRDDAGDERPAVGRTRGSKGGSSSRHGTKPPLSAAAPVPPRVTSLYKPSAGAGTEAPGTASALATAGVSRSLVAALEQRKARPDGAEPESTLEGKGDASRAHARG